MAAGDSPTNSTSTAGLPLLLVQEREEKMGKAYRLRIEPGGPLSGTGHRALNPRAHLVHVATPVSPDSRPTRYSRKGRYST